MNGPPQNEPEFRPTPDPHVPDAWSLPGLALLALGRKVRDLVDVHFYPLAFGAASLVTLAAYLLNQHGA